MSKAKVAPLHAAEQPASVPPLFDIATRCEAIEGILRGVVDGLDCVMDSVPEPPSVALLRILHDRLEVELDALDAQTLAIYAHARADVEAAR